MNDTEIQRMSGRLYAFELMLNALLKDYVARNADTGQDTEHLEAFVRDLAISFAGRAKQMTPEAISAADEKIQNLIQASLPEKYWKKT